MRIILAARKTHGLQPWGYKGVPFGGAMGVVSLLTVRNATVVASYAHLTERSEKYPQIGMYIYMLFCYTLHEYIDNGRVFVGSRLNRSLG